MARAGAAAGSRRERRRQPGDGARSHPMAGSRTGPVGAGHGRMGFAAIRAHPAVAFPIPPGRRLADPGSAGRRRRFRASPHHGGQPPHPANAAARPRPARRA
ncbi:hypothetical protein G6F22_021266 [Rhizopus arrhizus]|nr:hypothetical protein G6F22_021266 [Rhizopus arrhizus]KAG1376589.1 hypothetical protein G6F60_015369 [Rhizopus arrhizus]